MAKSIPHCQIVFDKDAVSKVEVEPDETKVFVRQSGDVVIIPINEFDDFLAALKAWKEAYDAAQQP